MACPSRRTLIRRPAWIARALTLPQRLPRSGQEAALTAITRSERAHSLQGPASRRRFPLDGKTTAPARGLNFDLLFLSDGAAAIVRGPRRDPNEGCRRRHGTPAAVLACRVPAPGLFATGRLRRCRQSLEVVALRLRRVSASSSEHPAIHPGEHVVVGVVETALTLRLASLGNDL